MEIFGNRKPFLRLILNVAEVAYANSLDPDETPSNSVSHPNPNYLADTMSTFQRKIRRSYAVLKMKKTRVRECDNFDSRQNVKCKLNISLFNTCMLDCDSALVVVRFSQSWLASGTITIRLRCIRNYTTF